MKENSRPQDNENLVALLKRIQRFEVFSDAQIAAFLQLSRLREYQAGEVLIREGEYDCWMYFLLSGTLEIVQDDEIIGKLQRGGELFGEMGVIDGSPRSASIRAATKALVLGIDASVVDQQLQGNEINFCYTIYRMFAEVLAIRLRDTSRENARLRDENQRLKGNRYDEL
jgi:CRP-like cAMP-binding protein